MNRQDVYLVLITSIGLILAFPPIPLGSLAVVVLVPFFYYLRGKGIWEAMRGGYAVGLIWAAGTVYWIGWATGAGLIGALLFLPLYYALFAGIQAWLWNRWGNLSFWAAPFVWTGVEMLSSCGVLGFPWNALAHTQTNTPLLIQYASITGMFGVSFWIVLLNVLFFYLLQSRMRERRPYGLILGIGCLIILPTLYGRWVFSHSEEAGEKVKVSLVQGNIDPYKKWTPSFIDSNFVVYGRLSRLAGCENPDLIVWPETAVPCYLRHRFSHLRQVKSQMDSLGVPLLTGAPDYEWIAKNDVKKYNGALLIHPNSWKIDRYYKMKLVPFSERVPFTDFMPFLYTLSSKIDPNVGDFTTGDSIKVFRFRKADAEEDIHFSAIICYESIFPYFIRKFVQKGAQFLIIITNDGWFGNTSGPYQHARIAVLRAIENRIWIGRSANTGISEFIDPLGRVRTKTTLNQEAVLTGSLTLSKGQTVFVKWGYGFPFVIILTNGFVFLVTIFRKKAHRSAAKTPKKNVV